MSWRTHLRPYDDDTFRMLDIAANFLAEYFGHSRTEAESMLIEFLKREESTYDEDGIHHEGAYRVAAAAQYVMCVRGPRDGLGAWLVESGHADPPAAAMEYFRAHYFTQ